MIKNELSPEEGKLIVNQLSQSIMSLKSTINAIKCQSVFPAFEILEDIYDEMIILQYFVERVSDIQPLAYSTNSKIQEKINEIKDLMRSFLTENNMSIQLRLNSTDLGLMKLLESLQEYFDYTEYVNCHFEIYLNFIL